MSTGEHDFGTNGQRIGLKANSGPNPAQDRAEMIPLGAMAQKRLDRFPGSA
jgi:hypothetical protein